MMKALIVGGTGPSGPFLANGLIERGYQVTIFHRGTHEIPEIVPEVAHIHGDPHFRETIEAALGDRTFDVVIATYGRIRFVAEALAGKSRALSRAETCPAIAALPTRQRISGGAEGPRARRCAIGDERTGAARSQ